MMVLALVVVVVVVAVLVVVGLLHHSGVLLRFDLFSIICVTSVICPGVMSILYVDKIQEPVSNRASTF